MIFRKIKILLLVATLFCQSLTLLHAQTVKDVDGNIYFSVVIGSQTWMAENLKTTKFNDGTEILLVTDKGKWNVLKTPAFCWFNNELVNKDEYGALYNWYTVNTGKICPKGWHVPSEPEWTKMLTFLGDENRAGDILKEKGVDHWKNYLINVTNDFEFTALPGGMRLHSGDFPVFGSDYAIWWSSTEYNATDAWNHGLHDSSSKAFKGHDFKRSGFSIRCIKD